MKIILAFLVVLFVFSSCGSFNKILKSNDVEYKYKKAVEYYNKGKYNYAQQIFENIFPLLKGTKEFEDAFYKFAYCYYYQADYFNAENLFKQFSEVFPNSPKAIEMEYMRAYTYYKQSPKVDLEQANTAKTITMMQQFINQHQGTDKAKEAEAIIAKCREKIESKDYKAAQLYYQMGQFKAASVAFANMLNTYPESNNSDQYKYMSIKAYYQYATKSIEERQTERYEQVINECNDFIDKYPDSKLLKDIEQYSKNSSTNIKNIKNEQTKKTTSS
jgi:outer membrane protein assembly factor BamD